MKISLATLEKAVRKIQSVSQVEFDVNMGDTKLVFRLLTPLEEVDMMEYVYILVQKGKNGKDGDEEYVSALAGNSHLSNCYKTSLLTYSLVQIDELDLRKVDVIETESGLRPKHEVLSEMILNNWDSTWLVHLYMVCMARAMEEGIKMTSKVKIDLREVQERLEYHENEAARLREKLSQFGQTTKQRLADEIAKEDAAASPPSQTPDNEERKDLLPDHSSSFLDESNPEDTLRREGERIRQIQTMEWEKQERIRQEQAQFLAAQEERDRKLRENPKFQEGTQTWEAAPPVRPTPVPPSQPPAPEPPTAAYNRGVSRALSSVQSAFQAGRGGQILQIEPEEYLGDKQGPVK